MKALGSDVGLVIPCVNYGTSTFSIAIIDTADLV